MILNKNKLTPSAGMHLKNIHNGDVYDAYIYLGKYDSEDNYIEVSEEEYQAFINRPPVELKETQEE